MSENMEVMGSKLWVINFYKEQLNKFEKVGLGKLTEHDVKVTPNLIRITQQRLDDLSLRYDNRLLPSAFLYRERRARIRQAKRNRTNGQLKHDGAAPTKSGKDISDTGHEGNGS